MLNLIPEDRQRPSLTYALRALDVSVLENGRYNPSLKLAMDIARELHASVYELFFFKDE